MVTNGDEVAVQYKYNTGYFHWLVQVSFFKWSLFLSDEFIQL